MVTAAILATLPGSTASREKGLYIDGLDVLAPPGGNYGTDYRTIRVTEGGPGLVSSIAFTVEDQSNLVAPFIYPGQFIVYWDFITDMPIFAGWVESIDVVALGGIGSALGVTGIGIETLLDWMYVPAFTIPVGTDPAAGFQLIVAAAVGVGYDLRTASDPGTPSSTLTFPVKPVSPNVSTDVCNLAGGSLRQMLQQWSDFLISDANLPVPTTNVFTVDFYGNLRLWRRDANTGQIGSGVSIGNPPSDYNQLVYLGDDNTAHLWDGYPANTRFSLNNGGTPRQVYVSGSGLGTGVVGDGSGIPGPVGVISDANSTTAARRFGIGGAFLRPSSDPLNATVDAEAILNLGSVGAQRRAGGFVVIVNDASIGMPLASGLFISGFSSQVDKSWDATGNEYWTIHFGGAVTKASVYLRRLAPNVLI